MGAHADVARQLPRRVLGRVPPTETNPDARTFVPQAVAEFRRAVNELFGADTEGLPLR